MKHRIDPKVDCVFKAMLGAESNTVSLVHFLNAVLKPDKDVQIKEAIILNPYNEREFINDKLSIVDVKARDEKGHLYQIEIQLTSFPTLRQRILYTWSRLYHTQIESGDEYHKLQKTVSIWLIADTLFKGVKEHHLPFCLYNKQHNLMFTDHMQIHVVQLSQWRWEGTVREELDRWMYLFTQGEQVDLEDLPEILQVKEMKPAMDTLMRFTEREKEFDLYERRRLAIMDAKAIKAYKEELEAQMAEILAEKARVSDQLQAIQAERQAQQAEMQARQAELQAEMQARQAELQAEMQAEMQSRQAELQAEMQARLEKEQKEKERLLSLLKQAGIDPS